MNKKQNRLRNSGIDKYFEQYSQNKITITLFDAYQSSVAYDAFC